MSDSLRTRRVRTIELTQDSVAYLLSSILRHLIHICSWDIVLSSLCCYRRLRLISSRPIQHPQRGFMSDKLRRRRTTNATKVRTWLETLEWTPGAVSATAPRPGTWRPALHKLVRSPAAVAAVVVVAERARRNRPIAQLLHRTSAKAAASGHPLQSSSRFGLVPEPSRPASQ